MIVEVAVCQPDTMVGLAKTSASIAETSTGIDRMNIDKVCRGTGSLDGGFIWRFTDQKDMDAYTG